MWEAFVIVGALVGVMGIVVCAVSRDNDSLFVVGIGVLMIVGGVGLAITSSIRLDNVRDEYESRITTVTEVVAESHQTWTKEDGCVQSFTLKNVPYTLEKGCASLVKYSYSPPKVGDVLRVKFVRPKNSDGKPEVLEVYNLTQEMERARSAQSSAPEAPPAN